MNEEQRSRATLDDWGRIKAQVTVMGRDYWVRALSAKDVQDRDDFALRVSMRRRKQLKTPNTPEYEMYIEQLGDEHDDVLRSAILAVEVQWFQREAEGEIKLPMIPFPDNATDDEKEQVLDRRDEAARDTITKRREFVKAKMDARSKELEPMTHEQLVALTKERQIEAQGRAAYMSAFVTYTVYCTYFSDKSCKERIFNTPDDVGELDIDLRQQMVDAYFEALNSVTEDDIKYFLLTKDSKGSS